MTRRWAALAVAVALVLAPVPARAADPSPVEYSLDGLTWSPTPPASVFPATWRPVPGAVSTATLHVRAVRTGQTVVGVYSGGASSSDPVLLAGTTLSDGLGRASALSDLTAACALVAPQTVLAQGETLSVPLTVALSPALTSAREATLRLGLLIALTDTGVPTLPGGCPVDPDIIAAFAGGTSSLGRTGGQPPVPVAVVALALLGGGAVAMLIGRRGRRA